jgi:DNA-binding PadR family transcriptional regulator
MVVRRAGPRVRRGDVRAAILALLAENPRNGYQVMQDIAQRSRGFWRPSSGSVYPALQQLEDEGLVSAQEQEGKRTFDLTGAGRAYVEEHREELTAPWDAVTDTVGDRAVELTNDLGQVSAALMQVGQVGTEEQVEEARRILSRARRALYELLAKGPSDAPEQTGPGV